MYLLVLDSPLNNLLRSVFIDLNSRRIEMGVARKRRVRRFRFSETRGKKVDSIEMKDVLSELHREFHKRREHIFDALRTYATFCGISVGWVVTAKTLGGLPRFFLVSVILFFAIAGLINGLGVSRSQSNTAKTIVKINENLGLFDKYFPSEWRSWGQRRDYWYVVGFPGVGVVAIMVILFYWPNEGLTSKEAVAKGSEFSIILNQNSDAHPPPSNACCRDRSAK